MNKELYQLTLSRRKNEISLEDYILQVACIRAAATCCKDQAALDLNDFRTEELDTIRHVTLLEMLKNAEPDKKINIFNFEEILYIIKNCQGIIRGHHLILDGTISSIELCCVYGIFDLDMDCKTTDQITLIPSLSVKTTFPID